MAFNRRCLPFLLPAVTSIKDPIAGDAAPHARSTSGQVSIKLINAGRVFNLLVASLQQHNLTITVVRPSVRMSECPSAVMRELKRLLLVNGRANLYQILCEAS